MPRPPRFIEQNAFYHIISRSLNDTRILRNSDDFNHFFQLLQTAKQKYPIRIFHYAVMHTHFHLAAQALNQETLSKNITYLKWHYSLWMHKKYNWKGPLWRERYKSLPIENENYLYACGMYIEHNPVRAGICENPADYPYSSYKKYNSQTKDTLIDDYEPQNGACHVLCDWHRFKPYDFTSTSLKPIFSHSPAIGSPLFIAKFKHPKNACPQK